MNFLDNINTTIDMLNPLIQNGIDIDNNMTSERQVVTLSHGVAIKISLRKLSIRPALVRVGYAAGHVGVGAITTYNADGSLNVTVYFQGTAPTAAVATTLIFEP